MLRLIKQEHELEKKLTEMKKSERNLLKLNRLNKLRTQNGKRSSTNS